MRAFFFCLISYDRTGGVSIDINGIFEATFRACIRLVYAHPVQEELLDTINDAVKDYVRHRGLRYACGDVRRWGPPPGPAAHLHSRLLKVGGTGSLPRGLACYRGRVTGSTDRDEKIGCLTGGGSHLEHPQISPDLARKSEGSGGSFNLQMLSCDDVEMSTMGAVQGPCVVPAGGSGPSVVDSEYGELTASQSTPELAGQKTGGRAQDKMNKGESNADQAKQVRTLALMHPKVWFPP